jgi:nitrile hydratase accessory protein
MSTTEHTAADDQIRVEALLERLPQGKQIPRQCGEASFDAPWELRALALGVAAHEVGRYEWDEFQHALISSIRDWESSGDDGWRYYERWLSALEALLARGGVVAADELDSRTRIVLDTPRDASHQHAHPDPVAVDSGH